MSTKYSLKAEMASEFFGTMILITFGAGVVASAVLLQSIENIFQISIGWGLAVTFGVYAAGGISGAHINPAVTLAFAVKRNFPWGKVFPFILSQTAGAFAGAWLVYILFNGAFHAHEAAENITRGSLESLSTAGVFITSPKEHLSGFGAFFSEFLLTAFLIIIVFSVVDDRNLAPASNMGPLLIGLGVAAIGICFGEQTGFAINPARDFGPRLFTALAGWKTVVFTGNSFYFWIPIAAPCCGGIAGAFIYDLFIGNSLKTTDSSDS